MRTLLIDADVVAYKAATSVEVAAEWEPGYWTWHCDEYEVRRAIDDQIDKVMGDLDGKDYRLCLTDSAGNFRKRILPTYKGNRSNVKKPLVLKAIRQWLIEEKGAYLRPGLEGDDCMGIFATWSKLKGEKVIVSIDKDMKTIPGLYSRDGETIVEVSEDEADYWHLFQTLTGDQTDGYSGCPGIGPKKAEAILQHPDNQDDLWGVVVRTFVKAGLNEDEALVQARVARILRASDYDFEKKEPILWTP
jgi:DNA polymerase-1